jgi:RNase H-fold protein (predicted Holliday junction resolvase)
MLKTKKPFKILAIDPGTRYLGIAVLQNQELIYWAVKTIQRLKPSNIFSTPPI